MAWWQSILLGLVEGVTEFLPVSSTGHLLLTERALGMPDTEAARAYAICIQFGAIVAVLALYHARVLAMIRGVLGRDPRGRALAVNLVVAFLPAAVIGKLFNDPIERVLFGLWPVVAAWLVGGVVILALWRGGGTAAGSGGGPYRTPGAPGGTSGRTLDELAPKHALLIGLAQCAALWPGTSRSLATIVGATLLGLSMSAAVEFSFLLGLLTLSAAAGYKALKSRHAMMDAYGPAQLALGFAVAAASAFVAARWMVAWLQRHGLSIFGWYRVALAAVVAALLLAGALHP